MKKSLYMFSAEEYMFLHQTILKISDSQSKLLRKIKLKRGIGLDRTEVRFVKSRFNRWVNENGNFSFMNGNGQRVVEQQINEK